MKAAFLLLLLLLLRIETSSVVVVVIPKDIVFVVLGPQVRFLWSCVERRVNRNEEFGNTEIFIAGSPFSLGYRFLEQIQE